MIKAYNRRADKQRADRRGFVLIGGCVMAIASVAIGMAATRAPERDKQTGCVKVPAAVQRVIIADRTEAFGSGDGVLLSEAMMSLLGSTQTGDRVSLLAFDGGEEVSDPLFDRCRPPEGKDVSSIFGNKAHADKQLAQGFLSPASLVVRELSVAGKAPETHLLGYLVKAVSRLRYQHHAERLVVDVYSDMGEATKDGSFLKRRKVMDAATFKAYFERLGGDKLKGVELNVHVLPTASTKGDVALRIKQAWISALQGIGVTVTWETL